MCFADDSEEEDSSDESDSDDDEVDDSVCPAGQLSAFTLHFHSSTLLSEYLLFFLSLSLSLKSNFNSRLLLVSSRLRIRPV